MAAQGRRWCDALELCTVRGAAWPRAPAWVEESQGASPRCRGPMSHPMTNTVNPSSLESDIVPCILGLGAREIGEREIKITRRVQEEQLLAHEEFRASCLHAGGQGR